MIGFKINLIKLEYLVFLEGYLLLIVVFFRELYNGFSVVLYLFCIKNYFLKEFFIDVLLNVCVFFLINMFLI